MFPYVCLLLGLMRGIPAAAQADFPTKMSVVVTLWLVTSYLMLHVASVLKSVFGVLSVWHRLVAMFDAYEDERVPRQVATRRDFWSFSRAKKKCDINMCA